MTKAEQRAFEAYPRTNQVQYYHREGFVLGYEQAEKDLEPIIRAAINVYESWQGGTIDEVRNDLATLGEFVKPLRNKEAKKCQD